VWSGPITVCFWLKEKKQQTEQHPPVSTGSPRLSARGSLESHRGCPCPVVLMELSLPSWPDPVSWLPAMGAWEGVGRGDVTCPGERGQLSGPVRGRSGQERAVVQFPLEARA